MVHKNILVVFFLFAHFVAFGQGKVLLVGGGAEENTDGSWSNEPYIWAVQKSENKKVAILAYGSETSSWMRNYFIEKCGAIAAKHFDLSKQTIINSNETYTELMEYDVFFIKGGDQYNYYSGWKNTKIQQAIEDKFTEGGVICGTSAGMAILSDVIFSAQNGTVYPDECLENANNSYIVLKNDFLDFFDNFIFDTHFVQRGRFARLMVFLLNYYENNGTKLTGFGVDDLTAMAIDENLQATVYGTGAVTIVGFNESTQAGIEQNIPYSDSFWVKQLIKGCSIDLNTMQTSGFNKETPLPVDEFTGNYTIMASGSNLLADNNAMLADFVNTSTENSNIIVITSGNESIANTYSEKLTELGATTVDIITIALENISNQDMTSKINNAGKALFVNCSASLLEAYITLGETGKALNSMVQKDGFVSAFVGDNARIAGKTVVNNYLTENAAFYGELTFSKGISLVDGAAFLPSTYQNSSLFENTSASLPYAMVTDSLFMGVWLSAGNYIKLYPENGKTYMKSNGEMPVIVMTLEGTETGFATQTARGFNSETPRQIAGFAAMKCSILKQNTAYLAGNSIVSAIPESTGKRGKIKVYPVPAFDILKVDTPVQMPYIFHLYSLDGKTVYTRNFWGSTQLNIGKIKGGHYLYRIINKEGLVLSGKLSICR